MSTVENTSTEMAAGVSAAVPAFNPNIFVNRPNEIQIQEQIASSFSVFDLLPLIKNVKSTVNITHETLKKKSNVFIFGAGGTTSWFLPKILKIYNDLFHKVPSLKYNINIVLIDADIV